MRNFSVIILFLLFSIQLFAAPSTISDFIKIDQFGYKTNAQKIAVISDPQVGFNSALFFNPSIAANQYQIRRWSDDAVLYTGTLAAWSAGATHSQSGDKIWWFDFSTLTTLGDYYVYDIGNNVGSYRFSISDCIYKDVLKHAVRSFYYQRSGFAKTAAFAGAGWTDIASHTGAQQDLDCRLYSNPVIGTSKNLSGGWYDAGDLSKYVNFTWGTLTDLLLGYEEMPTSWSDDYNIPESGNGIPDLLDEVKYELDWLLKMQQPDGSVLSIVGHGFGSPPSADVSPARYGPATTSAALTCASVFALAAIQYTAIGMTAYATTLQNASINSWNWAVANPSVTWTNSGTGIGAGEQEVDDYGRLMRKLSAASYLYKLTGNATYKTFFESNYTQGHLLLWSYAFLFETYEQDILLYYTKVTGASPAVITAIRNAYSNSVNAGNTDNFPSYTSQTDGYRAYIRDPNYTWGSNSSKGRQGNMFMNMLAYALDAPNATNYRNAGSGFMHYIHGVNPFTLVYLSNMNAYGAEKSVKTFYHSWFYDGSALWDEVGVSTYGPAPGFLPGGPNPTWSLDGCCPSGCGGSNALCVNQTPPSGQPIQKSYKEWNTNWPQNSWSITENGIYYQAAYIKLLSKFIDPSCTVPLPLNILYLTATRKGNEVTIDWKSIETKEIESFELEYSIDGKVYSTLYTTKLDTKNTYRYTHQNVPHDVYYRIKQLNNEGGYSLSQNVFSAYFSEEIVKLYPNPAEEKCNLWIKSTSEKFSLRICDVYGNEVLKNDFLSQGEVSEIEIPLHQFSTGVYFISLDGLNFSKTLKMVKK